MTDHWEQDSTRKERSLGLLRSGTIVSSMTLISRILGLVRDMVVAQMFGAGSGADAFFVAFRIPNFFRRLFAEGAFSQAFVPVLSEYKANQGRADVQGLLDRVAGTLGLVLLIITGFGVLAAPVLISLFTIGWVYHEETTKFAMAVDMLRLTFPYLALISLTAFSGAILNTYNRFAVPAFTPVLLNVSLIVSALFLSPLMDEPVIALAWGVLLAGVAQLTFQLPFLHGIGLLPRPRIDRHHPGVRRVFTLMLPAMFGVSIGQINLLLDTLLASFLPDGSISWLYYSDRLLELPLALFGITLATVLLPSLSRGFAESDTSNFQSSLDWGLRLVCLVGVPSAAALIYLAEPIIATLFFRGEMGRFDVMMSAASLQAYAAGLLGHMMVKILAPGYFSRQDTRTPVRIGIIAMTSNMVLNLALIWRFGHVGLALATSMSAYINGVLLYGGLKRQGVLSASPGWLAFSLRVVAATFAMLMGLAILNPEAAAWYDLSFWSRVGVLLAICSAGLLTYLTALVLTGFRLDTIRR